MSKMHLTAAPANEGARRLAQWLMVRRASDLRIGAIVLHMTPEWLDRLLRGEAVPNDQGARSIAILTANVVGWRHWDQKPAAGWFVPLSNTEIRAAVPPRAGARTGGTGKRGPTASRPAGSASVGA